MCFTHATDCHCRAAAASAWRRCSAAVQGWLPSLARLAGVLACLVACCGPDCTVTMSACRMYAAPDSSSHQSICAVRINFDSGSRGTSRNIPEHPWDPAPNCRHDIRRSLLHTHTHTHTARRRAYVRRAPSTTHIPQHPACHEPPGRRRMRRPAARSR